MLSPLKNTADIIDADIGIEDTANMAVATTDAI